MMIPVTFINYRPAEKFCYIRDYNEEANIKYDKITIGINNDITNKVFYIPVKININLAHIIDCEYNIIHDYETCIHDLINHEKYDNYTYVVHKTPTNIPLIYIHINIKS